MSQTRFVTKGSPSDGKKLVEQEAKRSEISSQNQLWVKLT